MMPNKTNIWRLGLMALAGTMVALIGLGAVEVSSSQPPEPPLVDLLLQECDFAGHEFEREWFYQDTREISEFAGLPLDYLEGRAVYLVVYSPPEPKGVIQGLYRYTSEKEAQAHYEHLLKTLPFAPLGHETPIIRMSKRPFGGIQGQTIETQDPIGTAYWFVGTQGKLLMVMVVLGTETTGQSTFEELLPKALEKIAESQ